MQIALMLLDLATLLQWCACFLLVVFSGTLLPRFDTNVYLAAEVRKVAVRECQKMCLVLFFDTPEGYCF